jgi:hypothetical protein
VEKDKFWCLKKLFTRIFSYLFYIAHKICCFSRNLACTYRMSTCAHEIFVQKFLTFRMCFVIAGTYAPEIKIGFPTL